MKREKKKRTDMRKDGAEEFPLIRSCRQSEGKHFSRRNED